MNRDLEIAIIKLENDRFCLVTDRFVRTRDSFKLVHEGGHHWVFCDGEWHVQTHGGSVNLKNICMDMALPEKTHHAYRCDCYKFNEQ